MNAKLLVSFALVAALAGGHSLPAFPQLSDQANLEGILLDEQGKPIPFGSVKIEQPNLTDRSFGDRDGRFRFFNVPPGTYRIEAQAEGFEPARGELSTSSSNSRRVVLILKRAEEQDKAPADQRPVVTVRTLKAPGDARKRYEKALELYSKRKYESALEALDQALQKHKEYSEARTLRAYALQRLGRLDDALADFGEALSLYPDDYDANLGMAMTCNDLGRFAEAERHVSKAVASQPGQWATEMELGRAYYGQGRYTEAEQELQKALRLGAKEPSLYLLLANVALRQKKAGDAIAAMTEYLRVAPKGPLADEVRQRLREMEKLNHRAESRKPAE